MNNVKITSIFFFHYRGEMQKKLHSVAYHLQMRGSLAVCNPSHATQDPEDGGINLARNIDKYLSMDAASFHKISTTLYSNS
jgi:hypothetical protein